MFRQLSITLRYLRNKLYSTFITGKENNNNQWSPFLLPEENTEQNEPQRKIFQSLSWLSNKCPPKVNETPLHNKQKFSPSISNCSPNQLSEQLCKFDNTTYTQLPRNHCNLLSQYNSWIESGNQCSNEVTCSSIKRRHSIQEEHDFTNAISIEKEANIQNSVPCTLEEYSQSQSEDQVETNQSVRNDAPSCPAAAFDSNVESPIFPEPFKEDYTQTCETTYSSSNVNEIDQSVRFDADVDAQQYYPNIIHIKPNRAYNWNCYGMGGPWMSGNHMYMFQDYEIQAGEILQSWKEFTAREAKEDQTYDRELVNALGPDCAAANYFTENGAAIRLKGHKDWLKGGLPRLRRYSDGYFVDVALEDKFLQVVAVDFKDFIYDGIQYEGLEYLTGLNSLKWLSLQNQKKIDFKCLRRIAGQNGKTLKFLDLSGCNLDAKCIEALDEMPALREVRVTLNRSSEEDSLWNALSALSKRRPALKINVAEIEEEEIEENREEDSIHQRQSSFPNYYNII